MPKAHRHRNPKRRLRPGTATARKPGHRAAAQARHDRHGAGDVGVARLDAARLAPGGAGLRLAVGTFALRLRAVGVLAVGRALDLEQLRHDAEPHRQRAAQHLVGGLLDGAGEVLPDPLADEVVGDRDLQPVLAEVESR